MNYIATDDELMSFFSRQPRLSVDEKPCPLIGFYETHIFDERFVELICFVFFCGLVLWGGAVKIGDEICDKILLQLITRSDLRSVIFFHRWARIKS